MGRKPGLLLALGAVLVFGSLTARAAIQFDVFLGYDGIVPEASWFPVVCEIKTDGPSFTGTVEVSGGVYNQGHTIRLPVELPTGTLKRVVLPVFSSSRGFSTWDVRLLDEREKVRSEQAGMRARRQVARGTPLVGVLSRASGGAPNLKAVLPQAAELQPTVARLLPSIFPDNPLVLEGLTCLYLNSERATELSVNQVRAIYAWMNAGGHLIVGVEQPSDVSSSPWLKDWFPCEVRDLKKLERHGELQSWLRDSDWPVTYFPGRRTQGGSGRKGGEVESALTNPFSTLAADLTFESAEMQVAVAKLRDGKVEVAAGDTPLMVSAQRGRGRLTALLFSPEREPVRSWKNLDVFWARLAEVPGVWYVAKDFNSPGGWSSDGVVGAMIDSRQVHKLPVGWLLLLLLVYLVVIGPLDQYWLKRIGKPMLTWITFPCYVVAFSLVIYFIGYKLRSGESEWNELHVVDVVANGERADLRGRTYSSVYSPSNQRYTLESREQYATLRAEFAGLWGGGQGGEKATVLQNGDNFKAEIFVPVWTSELYVSDWWQSTSPPLVASVRQSENGWRVEVRNRTDRKLTNLELVVEDRIIALGELGAEQSKTFSAGKDQGMTLATYVWNYGSSFQNVVSSRQRALGASEAGQLADRINSSMAVSFLSQLGQQQNYDFTFVSPPGLDMSETVQKGGAVLLAWAGDYSPIPNRYLFKPRRSQRDTLWRIAMPIQKP
jgi:hypothetical protein